MMHYNNVLLVALAFSNGFVEIALAARQNAQASSASNAAQSQGGTPATLDASALQTASNQDGQGNGAAGVKAGQAKANT